MKMNCSQNMSEIFYTRFSFNEGANRILDCIPCPDMACELDKEINYYCIQIWDVLRFQKEGATIK